MMSNSVVKTHAQSGEKVFFVMGDRVERRARLEGTWLNVFDVSVPSGSRTPLHRHASPEVFRIIEGRLTIRRMTDNGLEEFEATAGDIVRIDADQAHGYSNPGPETAVFSAIVDNDMAEFFEATGSREPPKASPSADTLERVTAAANAHGITILAA
ncbi:cupin domain-containing protein [Rhizobium sp. S96]|jgi:quercetin dioxygenase-like cupin family protein|uniref:cupin domain-containing protein n=1 Tax=Rhizobium sp. S96 TaxID=3055140 RepID=UPI000DE50C64|nr:cupin domain-containing protein [Rhizobium sp. S96]MDM9618735.1 cupin domain-containing protein [Rhizobium sp. S96]